MQVGFVKQQSIVVQNDGERKEVKYLEMFIKPVFADVARFTLSKNKSDNESAPAYNIYAHNDKGWIKRKMKVGVLWLRQTDSGEDFMSGHIETPLVESGRMGIALWGAKPMYEGEEVDWLYDVSWKPYRPSGEEDKQATTTTTNNVPIEVAYDEDEIPF